MAKRSEGRGPPADPREIALEIVRRASRKNADGSDGIPYVLRISDPMTASERLQLAAVRLLRRPVAIMPHRFKSMEEWDRLASEALGKASVQPNGPMGPKRGVPSD